MTYRLIVVLLCLCAGPHTLAQTPDPYVPPALQDWTDWVLHDAGETRCPLGGAGGRACVWPGRIDLNLDADAGRFTQSVEVFADGWFTLPGAGESWPQDVTVDGGAAAVVTRAGRPAVWLLRGSHDLAGRFRWSRLPQSLPLANGTALITLRIAGQPVARPRWDRDGVWLTRGAQADEPTQRENRLSLTVYRTISDGAPPTVEFTLQVRVSGDSREENLGRLLTPGFAPAQMSAPLPARLSEDGDLIIQARPGDWRFRFVARAPAPLADLTFQPAGQYWPKEEVWSYASAPVIRVTEPVAGNPIDPQQAGVPERFTQLPAFRMSAGDTLRVVERQRGPSQADTNQLSLRRDLWLDFDRGGFTARDVLTGTMLRDWRLDLGAPLLLSSGAVSGSDGRQDLLITQNPDDPALRGVELRSPQVQLTTLARVDDGRRTMPVSGWRTRLDAVSTTLHLPPGHRLLHAGGADRQPGAWLSRWNLLDFFLLLLVAVAYWRLMSPAVGVLALLALALSMHEAGAPAWTWVNLAIAIALVRYLPAGRVLSLARGYRAASLALVLVLLLPFAAQQLRAGLYPQLENARGAAVHQQVDYNDALDAPMPQADASRQLQRMEEIVVTGSRKVAPSGLQYESGFDDAAAVSRYAKDARVQTGPGIPQWTWNRYALTWGGPVDEDQQVRLWVAPPWAMRVWRIGMIALLLALLGVLARPAAVRAHGAGAAVATLCALLFAGVLAPPPTAEAQDRTPDPALLEELRTRLLRPPECLPQCVDLARATVRFDARTLSIELIAHAAADIGLPVPGDSNGWYPQSVTVDGRAREQLRLTSDAGGSYQLRLTPGVHRITLLGALPDSSSVSVAFPLSPHHIQLDGDGWEVTGVQDGQLSAGALTLLREAQRPGDGDRGRDEIDVERFPAFVTVERVLSFDLDWSVTATVTRQAPRSAPIDVRLPLLDGEAVTSGSVETVDGHALLSLGAGENRLQFSSTLARTATLTLRAPTDVPWQEFWSLAVGPSWRLGHAGVPEMNIDRRNATRWQARFAPWPGEALAISVERPNAVDGLTLAIDAARLHEQVGQRSTSAELTLSYRATRGQQHELKLPPDSELIGVDVDGRALNLALDETGLLRMPLTPGEGNISVRWRHAHDGGWVTRSAAVDLLRSAGNVEVALTLPEQRWVLWTFGPRLGPAVLYWAELVLLVLAALVLARFGGTPLRFYHWLLLGLGFSTFFWPALAIVVAALLALGWRERHAPARPLTFNLLQVGLIGLTIAAGAALVTTIPFGLLGTPDMHVTGNGSYASALKWFADRSNGPLPSAGVLAMPLWIYKALILAWALWLAFALLSWLPWMWRAFSREGYWKRLRPLVQPTAPTQAEQS